MAVVAGLMLGWVSAVATEDWPAVRTGREGAPGSSRFAPEEAETFFLKLLLEGRLGRELGLTATQLEALERIARPLRERSRELRRELEESAVAQVRLMSADPIDEAALMAAVERTGRIRTELAKVHVQVVVALRRILTPEQMARARELLRQRATHRRDGHVGEDAPARPRGERGRPPWSGRDGDGHRPMRPAPEPAGGGGQPSSLL